MWVVCFVPFHVAISPNTSAGNHSLRSPGIWSSKYANKSHYHPLRKWAASFPKCESDNSSLCFFLIHRSFHSSSHYRRSDAKRFKHTSSQSTFGNAVRQNPVFISFPYDIHGNTLTLFADVREMIRSTREPSIDPNEVIPDRSFSFIDLRSLRQCAPLPVFRSAFAGDERWANVVDMHVDDKLLRYGRIAVAEAERMQTI